MISVQTQCNIFSSTRMNFASMDIRLHTHTHLSIGNQYFIALFCYLHTHHGQGRDVSAVISGQDK